MKFEYAGIIEDPNTNDESYVYLDEVDQEKKMVSNLTLEFHRSAWKDNPENMKPVSLVGKKVKITVEVED